MRMNARQRAHKEYANVGIHTSITEASPHRLVQILFEQANGELLKAKGAMKSGEIKLKGKAISQAIAVIGTLQSSLNMTDGGDLAVNLNLLYEYLMRRLVVANAQDDDAILDECMLLLRPVKESWDSIGEAVNG